MSTSIFFAFCLCNPVEIPHGNNPRKRRDRSASVAILIAAALAIIFAVVFVFVLLLEVDRDFPRASGLHLPRLFPQPNMGNSMPVSNKHFWDICTASSSASCTTRSTKTSQIESWPTATVAAGRTSTNRDQQRGEREAARGDETAMHRQRLPQ
jgi:hypothetical protein